MDVFCRIIHGDARRMSELEDESVHLVVTSPPYWQLKDYGEAAQIGFNDSYENYINNLNLVWNECSRALVPGCRLCVNIGDQFARSTYYGRYKVIPIRTEIIRFCESAGLDYMGSIIWQKVTTTNTSGGATIMGSFPFPRNGILKIDYEFILVFRKYGKAPSVSTALKQKSKMTTEEWNEYFSGHWSFPGEKQKKHLAAFPVELPHRLIRMFSFAGDTVLDPFLGSGTTSLAAMKLDRNSYGYEINGDFLPHIREKLGVDENSLFRDSDTDVEVIRQEPPAIDWKDEIKKLPCIFSDPVLVDRKKGSMKKRYGSKIDGREKAQEYYRVSEITDTERLVLNDGTKIRLLGIKEKSSKAFEAVEFLTEKTRGRRVYLRHDGEHRDEDGNLLCYLYLKNRTFINAHLIKRGLAGVDEEAEFSKRERFLKYRDKAPKE